jgi:nitronate monooxygenase
VTIATRLTKRFGIKHPIVLAPMTPAAGGALASAVAAAGGLGLLGGGYVDRVWFEAQSAKVTRSDVGAGLNEAAGAALNSLLEWECQQSP